MACKNQNEELRLIRINPKDKVRGFYALLTNGHVKCLPHENYIVPKSCLGLLDKEDIEFEVVKTSRK